LEPSIVTLKNDDLISVKHELVLSVIDGKICNAISDNRSAEKCYICGKVPKDMNILNMIKQRPIINHYSINTFILGYHPYMPGYGFFNASFILHTD